MARIATPAGTTVSYDRYGAGPPLVLVHGGFSDHITNWQEVKPLLQDRFTVYAVARRGRGETSRTRGHSVDDEAADVVAILDAIGQPAFLLGHSYGAVCALGAAARDPGGVRKLVLYEHPHPTMVEPGVLGALERLAEREDWDRLVETRRPRGRPSRRPHHRTRRPGPRGHDDGAGAIRRIHLEVPAGIAASDPCATRRTRRTRPKKRAAPRRLADPAAGR
ncbi:MAG TPA: alpha/beta hydrolase [Solirubrobacterales bacterium]|nr:alpha/beta hydrolase [Solirubrobacterales bacterium]